MTLREILEVVPKREEIVVEWYYYNDIEFAELIHPYGDRDVLYSVMDCNVIDISSDKASSNPIKDQLLIIRIDTTEKHFPKRDEA